MKPMTKPEGCKTSQTTMHIEPSKIRIEFEKDDYCWNCFAYYGKRQVGYAYLQESGSVLQLQDFKVENKVPFSSFWSRVGFPLRNRNFRGIGIGKLLLKRILQEANKNNIIEIYGHVTEGDLKETPHLLDWYRHFDFKVLPPEKDNTVRGINKISKNISASSE